VSIIYCVGDIFRERDVQALAHGCNCAGAMGKGIAKQFKQRWPKMYQAYKERCKQGLFNLGDVFVWEAEDITIFNLGTQKTWKTKANINAIETSFKKMLDIAEEKGITKILMPRIGAGLGGMDWKEVTRTIENYSNYTPGLLIYVCDEYVADTPLIAKHCSNDVLADN